MSARSQFVTKTGVIAATVGSAVGLGNIWRFPYEAGVHGGGAFLVLYFICVFVIGIPVLLAEFVLGRGTHKNALGAFRQVAPGRRVLQVVPVMGMVAALMILSFYSVVAGWIMEYLYQSVMQLFYTGASEGYAEHFAGFISNPWRPVMWTLIFLAINFVVLRKGIEKGIERVSNVFMPILFLILVAMCINSLLLPGASRGLEFLFKPRWDLVKPSTVIGAMGQAFFSLSLGLTCMLTYSSYFSDRTSLRRSATTIAVLDSLVAVMAGILIFPAVFSYGMEPQAGPKLVFETLPSIFACMPGGHLWSVLFFLLLLVASVTSTISMCEIPASYFIEERRMSRQGATGIVVLISAVFGTLCALSFGPLADFKILGLTVFDLFDYVSSNVLLPLGGIIMSLLVGWWIDRRIVREQLGAGGFWVRCIVFCMRWVAPFAIVVIFVAGLL